MWALETGSLVSKARTDIVLLCDLGELSSPLCASVYSPIKKDDIHIYFVELWGGKKLLLNV